MPEITFEQRKYIEQFWRKYEELNEIAPGLGPSNVDAQIEADIQHHVDMQKQFAKLRELEMTPFEQSLLDVDRICRASQTPYAVIAGIDRWEFQDILHQRRIPITIEAESAEAMDRDIARFWGREQ
jgi:hypothetical protein